MTFKNIALLVFGILFPFSLTVSAESTLFQKTVGNEVFSTQKLWSMRGFFDGIEQQKDESLTRFLNPDYSLHNKDYKPKLISLSGSYINQAGRKSFVRVDAKPSLDALAKEFYREFGRNIVIVSAYRSFDYQQRLWDLGRCDDGAFCALPGRSEHQLGLAIDVFDPSSAEEYEKNPTYKSYIDWMKQNAHRYGWTLSYQYGYKRDGYEPEPWHWRYVGRELATYLYDLNWNYTRLLQFYTSVSEY